MPPVDGKSQQRARPEHSAYVFCPVPLCNPLWRRCHARRGPQTFRPTAQWLTGHTSPDLLYLETKWASLIPYAKVADLLKDVLPVASTWNHETVRKHLQATRQRMEQALGEEQDCLFEGTEDDWAEQPLPDGPMTVGIDGGLSAPGTSRLLRSLAGKSIVASGGRKHRKFRRRNGLASYKPTIPNPAAAYGSY